MSQVWDNGVLRDARAGEITPISPPPTPARWRILKSTLYATRLTDAEATQLDAVVATLPPTKRGRWASIRWFWNDDPDILAATVALQWSPQRVAELLAVDPDPELAR